MLRSGEVHVVRVDLAAAADLSAPALKTLETTLDHYERTRANRLIFARDRTRFIVAHAAMRRCIGAAIGCGAEQVRFQYGPFGKPALANGAAGLHFNMSHSRTVALVAWAEADLGVDVEDVRDDIDELGIGEQVFSGREQRALVTLPAGFARRTGFYALWTRKEAVLKALGVGFSREAREIDLGMAPLGTGPWTWLDPATGEQWVVADVGAGSQQQAAIAIRKRPHPWVFVDCRF